MASSILRDQKVFFDGYDLTGYANALSLEYSADTLDETVLGLDTRKFKGGLKTVSAGLEGFFDSVPDGVLTGVVGASDKILSFGSSGIEGEVAYSFKSMAGSYKPGGAVGELMSYSLQAAATGKLIRGILAENNTSVQATGNGAARQLGAIGSGQKLFAILHVLSSSGSGNQTLDVAIKSDNASNFPSPTTQINFSQVNTSVGAQWAEINGPIIDDYWRPTWTIAGSGTPSFNFAIILAIL